MGGRILVVAIALLTWLIMVPIAGAQGPINVSGGGTGTFGGDLDGDGDIDGSQFGLGATIRVSGTSGHFLCAMAGRSDFLGLALMSVEGQVSSGTVNPDGSVTLSGAGTVNLGNGTKFTGVPFVVKVTAGGVGAGSLQLTVLGAFDGVPGDTIFGNGNYDLPVESVASGGIKVH